MPANGSPPLAFKRLPTRLECTFGSEERPLCAAYFGVGIIQLPHAGRDCGGDFAICLAVSPAKRQGCAALFRSQIPRFDPFDNAISRGRCG